MCDLSSTFLDTTIWDKQNRYSLRSNCHDMAGPQLLIRDLRIFPFMDSPFPLI